MSITISSLELENVKRIKAVKLTPSETGLTVIGGNNGQGKTSVLDSIAWALGGDGYRPSEPTREGSVIPPYLHITLSNGIVVERKGKNSDLKVIDPHGRKSGQQLLNAFISTFALDLPKFLNAGNREKADILLQIIGVGDALHTLETEETQIYNKRHAVGQIADQKHKYAREMMFYPDAPADPVSVTELIQQQQDILRRNGENQHKRSQLSALEAKHESLCRQIEQLCAERDSVFADVETARKDVQTLQDESTAELEQSILNAEQTNIQVRANLDRERAEEEAREQSRQYEMLTEQLEAIRAKKRDLLKGADLPLPGLTVENGELLYNGYKWDNMSGSEQLRVGTAIVRRLNPECGFVLLDKLEQMDRQTLDDFGAWLTAEGLQAIATRVSTGDECSVIISDGCVQTRQWKQGVF